MCSPYSYIIKKLLYIFQNEKCNQYIFTMCLLVS
ncbi:hypothetical protein CoNPh11_CDS0045 [Staphylococcus phage S-CoN_Ph11]|nr:hypothetical protein BE22_0041 [Staphylococcus phage vB_SepS_BE22]WNM51541.1 hypothetical protein CoNPh1_CDS0143 [Staphylococcus phage S-CoN_Ph1]WNM51572.1 hypothetical protein CoNPh2_CDS0017 [Staphylococcus phage S-CoN_Ph2]WNM51734.1 hypothetical protein CoNPh3_CDS0019 [Staphylococcus phage S-CoN_Ph3]WNM52029.1 hypothetical protein CoNPh4_CDS0154 [Staphylococcus phage S-CoN_Ph4]WNM52207.1 hypothetical protein CoNPh5_CDS0162 [Staphylococcus phage S-CoN_Ph5]WNM52228.1 hypothetical protein C